MQENTKLYKILLEMFASKKLEDNYFRKLSAINV